MLEVFTEKEIAEWKAIQAHFMYEMETLEKEYGKDVMLKGVRQALQEYGHPQRTDSLDI